MKNIVISFIKVLCASLVMGARARLLYNILLKYIGANLVLITAIIIGAVVYFVMIYFMKIDEVDSMMGVVKRKLEKASI